LDRIKLTIYLGLIGIVPIIICLAMTPIFSFIMSLLIYIVTPLHIFLVFVAIWYARKHLSVEVTHGVGHSFINARHVYIYAAITPITAVILSFLVVPPEELAFSAQDVIAFILFGVTCIIGLIAAILYKLPEKPKRKSIM
jgi:hypothetical protein